MRCKNCGYVNDDNVAKCIKCNAPLQGSMVSQPSQPVQPSVQPGQTVRETPIGSPSHSAPAGGESETSRRRPEPRPVNPQPVQPHHGGTINRWEANNKNAIAFLEPLDNPRPHPHQHL